MTPASFSTCCFQAMRFPPKSYNKDLESAEVSKSEGWTFPEGSREGRRAGQPLPWVKPRALSPQERREREQQDLEFAKEMAEDDDDSFP